MDTAMTVDLDLIEKLDRERPEAWEMRLAGWAPELAREVRRLRAELAELSGGYAHYQAENDRLRARLESAERVVEAARRWDRYDTTAAIRAHDAQAKEQE